MGINKEILEEDGNALNYSHQISSPFLWKIVGKNLSPNALEDRHPWWWHSFEMKILERNDEAEVKA